MADLDKLKVKLNGECMGTVELNGKEINVVRIVCDFQAAEPAKVVLYLPPVDVDIECEAEIEYEQD